MALSPENLHIRFVDTVAAPQSVTVFATGASQLPKATAVQVSGGTMHKALVLQAADVPDRKRLHIMNGIQMRVDDHIRPCR